MRWKYYKKLLKNNVKRDNFRVIYNVFLKGSKPIEYIFPSLHSVCYTRFCNEERIRASKYRVIAKWVKQMDHVNNIKACNNMEEDLLRVSLTLKALLV